MTEEEKQRYLEETAEACIGDLLRIGIPAVRPERFEINHRARKRFGQCRRERFPGGFTVSVMAALLEEGHEDALRSVLLHELLHTCPGCMNHGARWKRYAAKAGKELGVDLKRTNSFREYGLAETEADPRKKAVKHLFVCVGCGAEIPRVRESVFTKNYRKYRCAKCGGTFRKIF